MGLGLGIDPGLRSPSTALGWRGSPTGPGGARPPTPGPDSAHATRPLPAISQLKAAMARGRGLGEGSRVHALRTENPVAVFYTDREADQCRRVAGRTSCDPPKDRSTHARHADFLRPTQCSLHARSHAMQSSSGRRVRSIEADAAKPAAGSPCRSRGGPRSGGRRRPRG
jgi:hypothetical protein